MRPHLLIHLLRATAERTPTAPCLLTSQVEMDFAALDVLTARLADGLVRRGVRPGDRVVVHLDKSIEEAASILAITRAGAIFVDANLQLRSPQLRHILVDSGARVLIVSAARLPAIADALQGLEDRLDVVLVGAQTDTDGAHTPWSALVESGEPGFDEVRRIDADPAGILYTSGSTGAPKGVVVSHRNLVAGAESVATYLENTADDVLLSVLPFSFDYGLNQLTTTLLVGMRLVLQRYVGPADILSAARRHRITGLAGIPPIWTALADLDWSADAPFAHLRYITNSGGAFPPSLVDRYRARLPRTRLFLMYGLTEAFRATYLPPEMIDERPGSIGKAIPNAEIMLLDDAGAPCPPGTIGQIVQRGAHVALGYWNDPERTRQRYLPNPQWPESLPVPELAVFSGDYAFADDDGFLYFVGRRDEMIKSAGHRISPTEVEDHFHRTGLVRDAVAVGVPDAQLGQHIVLVCSLVAGAQATPESLSQAVQGDLPRYMLPRRVVIRDDLPRNANGKLDRSLVSRAVLSGELT